LPEEREGETILCILYKFCVQSPRGMWEEWKAEEQRKSILWQRNMDC
jgi:hypothetical protein